MSTYLSVTLVQLRESERVFRTDRGAKKENTRSPFVAKFTMGIVKSDLKDERRLLGGCMIFLQRARTKNRPEKVHEESCE